MKRTTIEKYAGEEVRVNLKGAFMEGVLALDRGQARVTSAAGTAVCDLDAIRSITRLHQSPAAAFDPEARRITD